MTGVLPIETSPSELADRHSDRRLRLILKTRERWLAEFRRQRFPQQLIARQRQLVAQAKLAIRLKSTA